MLGINCLTGKQLSGIEHLKQSISDILTTRIGTRVMRRDYGSRLPDLIDEPLNGALRLELIAATAEALARWEPRFKLTKVTPTRTQPGQIEIYLEGIYLPEGNPITLDGIIL
ncbi:GPW/gp25 family protein [Zooshikella harenae]|uniref:GPW/gp25 family protein n=1 Tax=Zooshikella harenae TaxID=2827238 RepID=A0ABS5ZJE2_9GAMM|nr:GPW/gp25 family protein [Zooshikella harenae]MBU2714206.1 GPW/gp25 family protein [Zooshikella harenae]